MSAEALVISAASCGEGIQGDNCPGRRLSVGFCFSAFSRLLRLRSALVVANELGTFVSWCHSLAKSPRFLCTVDMPLSKQYAYQLLTSARRQVLYALW
jgi:hypothetical protein